jgi:hypothetical protein
MAYVGDHIEQLALGRILMFCGVRHHCGPKGRKSFESIVEDDRFVGVPFSLWKRDHGLQYSTLAGQYGFRNLRQNFIKGRTVADGRSSP